MDLIGEEIVIPDNTFNGLTEVCGCGGVSREGVEGGVRCGWVGGGVY